MITAFQVPGPTDLRDINKMNLASLINGDLVVGANAQTGVVVGTIAHEKFASGRIGLLIG